MTPPYADTDFVYFDSEARTVIGPVQWSKAGNVKPLLKPTREDEGERGWRKSRRKEYYPWGSYRSLKHLYHLEGKERDAERTQTLDEALQRSLHEAYWDSPASSVAGREEERGALTSS
jgi:hypothetical protein